jgi:hypothetical protein
MYQRFFYLNIFFFFIIDLTEVAIFKSFEQILVRAARLLKQLQHISDNGFELNRTILSIEAAKLRVPAGLVSDQTKKLFQRSKKHAQGKRSLLGYPEEDAALTEKPLPEQRNPVDKNGLELLPEFSLLRPPPLSSFAATLLEADIQSRAASVSEAFELSHLRTVANPSVPPRVHDNVPQIPDEDLDLAAWVDQTYINLQLRQ